MGEGAGETTLALRALAEMSTSIADLAKLVGAVNEKVEGRVTHREQMKELTDFRREMVSSNTQAIGSLEQHFAAQIENLKLTIQRNTESAIEAAVIRALEARAKAEAAARQDIDNKAKDAVREVRAWLMVKGGVWGAVIIIGLAALSVAAYLGLKG